MDAATRKRLYNAFDPYQPLDPDHAFNLDIDAVQPEVRGYRWAQRLADRVILSAAPAQVFFSGLRGSGKSTELRRMAALLAAPGAERRLVAIVDAKESIDLHNAIDVPDLLAALVHGAEEAVLIAEGRDPEKALIEGYLSRLWAWLTKTDLELAKAEYQIPSGPKLVAEMKSRPSLRRRLRETLNAHLNRFIGEVRQELGSLDERARGAGYEAGLVVVFDTLEKLEGASGTFAEIQGSAEQVFKRDAAWFDLPLPVVWTVPPALAARARPEVSFLPLVKLRDHLTGARVDAGYAAMKELVGKRASALDLEQILGPGHNAALERLITASGGYTRDLLRMLRELALCEGPATAENLERTVASLVDEVVRIVPTSAYPWLQRVATGHAIATTDDAEKALADRLIANNVVLRYQNASPWYDVHPALRSIPQIATTPKPAEDSAWSGPEIEARPDPTIHHLQVERLEIHDFRCIGSLVIDFSGSSTLPGNWTCIAGINGSGKSSVLQALCLMLLGPDLSVELGRARLDGMRRRENGTTRHPARLSAVVRHGDDTREIEMTLGGLESATSSTSTKMDAFWRQRSRGLLLSYGASRNLSEYEDGRYRGRVHPEVHRQVTLFDPLARVVGAEALVDTEGLSGEALELFLAVIERVFVEESLAAEVMDGRLMFHSAGTRVTALDLPDGFRSTVAWLADLCLAWAEKAEAPSTDPSDVRGVVLIDEIDLHLHPSLQRELVPRLRETFPGIQWVVTTHSPLVLSCFDKNELVLLDHDAEGGVRALDRQIMGFTMDQVYEHLMATEPAGGALAHQMDRLEGLEADKAREIERQIATMIEQSPHVDACQAEQRIARRRQLLESILTRGSEE
ncbi:MAG: AAA family ATPase [Pseudomonadota bacterium]